MMRTRPDRVTVLLAALATAIVCAMGLFIWMVCGELSRAGVESDMNGGALGSVTKTVCIGRFLIDVPSEAEVSFGPASMGGWSVSVVAGETEQELRTRLERVELDLRNEKRRDGKSSLESVTKVDTDLQFGRIFVYGRETISGFDGRETHTFVNISIDGFAWINRASVAITAKNTIPEAFPRILELLKRVSPFGSSAIPETEGFCIGGGTVLGSGAYADHEAVTMFVSLKNHPDVAIAIYTSAGHKPGSSLLERDAGNSVKIGYASHFKKLRSGQRILAGIQGDEIAEVVTEENGTKGHSVMWESQGSRENVLSPFISIEMSTGHGQPGEPVMSSLRDAEALRLWDNIVSSFRVRPTFPKIAASELRTVVSAGALVRTGTACPESGWWLAADAPAADERWIGRGQAMPTVATAVSRTIFERLTGKPSVAIARTVWKFLRYDEGGANVDRAQPKRSDAQDPENGKAT